MKRDLDRHENAVHRLNHRFLCPELLCEYGELGNTGGFSRQKNLARHISNQHPTQNNPATKYRTGHHDIEESL